MEKALTFPENVAIWHHGKCIKDFRVIVETQTPTALHCQAYCKLMEKDAFTFYTNSTCQLFKIRSFEKIKYFQNSKCVSAHVSDPAQIFYKMQTVYIGYMYRKIPTPDGPTCTKECNYDYRAELPRDSEIGTKIFRANQFFFRANQRVPGATLIIGVCRLRFIVDGNYA